MTGRGVQLAFGNLPTGVTAGSTSETIVAITDDDTPTVTVSFGSAAYSVAEGGTVEVTVTLDRDPERTVTIPLTATLQGQASAADYSGVPASVEFASGKTAREFTVSATDDQVDDDGESVKLSFGTLLTGVSAGSVDETTVGITDNDTRGVTVSESTLTINEGGSKSYTVVLDTQPSADVTVTVGGEAGDVTADPTTLTFTTVNWSTAKTVTVSAAVDTDALADAAVTLTHTASGGDYESVSADSVIVTITESDSPTLAVSDAEASEADDTVGFEVTLSTASSNQVTVTYATSNGTATAGSDYTATNGTLTFAVGSTASQTISVPVIDDSDDEPERETFTLTLSGATSAMLAGGQATLTATGTIIDDDDPQVTVSFGASAYTVAEGGSVTVAVTLSADPERSVTIPLTTTEQDGASSADYTGLPASVAFGGGETLKTFTFSASADDADDDGESVKIALGTLPTGVSAGSTSETTVAITDDDDPQVTVNFGSAAYTVAEGGSVTVTVTLSADPERSVTIPLTTTDQGGASSADYTGVPASVAFGRGETSTAFTFSATADAVDDDGESVKLAVGTLPTSVSAGSTSETTVAITDDDVPAVSVSFGSSAYSVAEGGTVEVTVTLDKDPERTVRIPLTTTEQDGASSADYSGVPASVAFARGETSTTFAFSATADSVDDDGESVKLGFGTLPTGVSAGSVDETTVSITDNDAPQVTVSFGASAYSVAEGSAVTVTVTLSADPEGTVTIPLTTAEQGGATSADYSGVPATITFNSGDTAKSLTFSAASDTDNDDGESVKLGFGTLPTRVTAGSTNEAIVSITDADDSQVAVSFGASAYSVVEGATVTVRVTLSADPERKVTIPLTTTDQAGASGADYSGVPSNVTFNSGETARDVTVAATDDQVDDDGESIGLGFGTLPGGVSAGSIASSTVGITDNDVRGVTVSKLTLTIDEGGRGSYTVVLDTQPTGDVTATVGGASGDVTTSSPTLTFTTGNWHTAQTVTVSAAEDDDAEADPSVTLTHTVSGGDYGSVTADNVTVTVVEKDTPTLAVSDAEASEAAGTVDFVVTLSPASSNEVTVDYATSNKNATAGSDYTATSGTLTFAAGSTASQTVSVPVIDDSADESDETFTLTLSGAANAMLSGGGQTLAATGTITDNDDSQVTVSFGAATYTATEGRTVEVTVTLSTDPERSVTIPLTTTEQGGASIADYTGVPANVVFSSGDTEKSFTFSATADAVDDDGESVKLGFGTLPPGVSAGSVDATTVSISDDDAHSMTISFGAPTYSVAEGSTVTVKVTLSASPDHAMVIPLSATPQGQASTDDYSGVPASLTFERDETEQAFAVSATVDDVDDDGESVLLTFTNLPVGVTPGSVAASAVSITDDVETAAEQNSEDDSRNGSPGDSRSKRPRCPRVAPPVLRVIGQTDVATAYELPHDLVLLQVHNSVEDTAVLRIGWIAEDGRTLQAGGFVRDDERGLAYTVLRRKVDGKIVRRWVAPDDPLTNAVPWDRVNSQYTFPAAVLAAIPLDELHPVANQLAQRADGTEDRVWAYDAGIKRWWRVPSLAVFEALGFSWRNLTAADAAFDERITADLLSPFPRIIGQTSEATAYELLGDYVVLGIHDQPETSVILGVGWIAADGLTLEAGGIVRDAARGQTYTVIRRKADGMIVRRWVASDDPLVNAVPWDRVNRRFTFPAEVLAAIPLDERYPLPNQLAQRFDGSEEQVWAYDAGTGHWWQVPDLATFQARGFSWVNVTAADADFVTRVTTGAAVPRPIPPPPSIARRRTSKECPPPTPPIPRIIGQTFGVTAYELPHDQVLLHVHDRPEDSAAVGVGWIASDGATLVPGGFVRDAAHGQTYTVIRREADGMMVRRWVAPDDPLVNAVPWDRVNRQYTFSAAVLAAVPLDERHPVANQLAQRFDGTDERVWAYDAGIGRWWHVPNPAVFEALGFSWQNLTAADAAFAERITAELLSPFPRINGQTSVATAYELSGHRVLLAVHDQPVASVVLAVGWSTADGRTRTAGGFVRDATHGQTYTVIRREADGMIVRRWVAPDDPLVHAIPWDRVNRQYTFPAAVLAAIPLDE